MKKTVSGFLSLLLTLCLLCGCFCASASAEPEEVTLSLVSYRELQKTPVAWYETDVYKWIFDQIADKYGYRINLEYDCYDNDKLNLMYASGELPDIVYFYTAAQVQTVMDNGYALNLAPLLEEYAPHVLDEKFAERNSLMQSLAGGEDNGLYFIPTTFGLEMRGGGQNSVRGYAVNWEWYKEIGAPDITNDADYIDALAQMVEKHPQTADGKPVYGYGYIDDFNNWTSVRAFPTNESLVNQWTFSGYLYMEGMDDNVLYNGYTNTERSTFWQEMRFANALYNKGLLDPDSFTQTNAELVAKIEAGQYAGVTGDNSANGYVVAPATGAMLFGNKIHLAGYYPDQQVFVSSFSENWKAALAWIDYMHTEEAERALYSGIEGVHWNYVDGVPTLTDETIAMYQENGDALKQSGVAVTTAIRVSQPGVSHSDGYPLSLFDTDEMRAASLTPILKDYSDYYGVSYPSQARQKLVEEGKIIDHSHNFSQLVAVAREPIPTDILRILTKCNDVVYTAVPKLVMAATQEEFNAIQEQVLADLEKAGEPEAWAWASEAQAKAHSLVDPIIGK